MGEENAEEQSSTRLDLSVCICCNVYQGNINALLVLSPHLPRTCCGKPVAAFSSKLRYYDQVVAVLENGPKYPTSSGAEERIFDG